ncbi:MAG: PAS domain-containing protein [Candidatus Eremiobacteraeota bacterium]|nr:PAS domain-containing protein [Candidatus Eremiobacteraeota bacterium]
METELSDLQIKCARQIGRAIGVANLAVYPVLTGVITMASELSRQHSDWLIGVALATSLVGLPRYLYGRLLLTAPPERLAFVLRTYIALAFLVAGLWAAFVCLVVTAYPGEWTSLLVVMITAGITAGSTSGLNSHLFLQMGFVGIMMLPPGLAMALSGGKEEAWASLTLAIYALFVIRTGIVNYQHFVSLMGANRELETAHEHEKRQRDQLRLLEERWSFAFQGSGSGVWDLNPQTHQMYSSPRLREMLQIPQEDEWIRLEDWFGRICPEDLAAVQQALQKNLDGHSDNFACENRLLQTDGSQRWTMARGKVVERDEQGQALRMVGTCTEIDDLKQLQIQLNLSRNLESVGQLAAGVAHEINTPLQYINDNVRFLEDSFQELMDCENADLEYLRQEVPPAFRQTALGLAHVTKIVSAMREFTHSGRGDRQPVDLNHLVETSLTICRSRLREVKEVKAELAPDLPLLPAVQSELNQVILNLLINAADAIGDRQRKEPDMSGQILISTRLENERIEILVRDNGCGIDALQEQKVFEPFFTTKEVGKGTGQGLALCRNIVRGHQGEIRFSSQAGHGTTFLVRLPLKAS